MPSHPTTDASAYPYYNSLAARMLCAAITRHNEQGVSLRQLAGRLGYKSATVLSHMRLGRIPVPMGRCVEISNTLSMDLPSFLLAVLKQQEPEIDFEGILGIGLDTPTAEPDPLDKPADLDGLPGRVAGMCRYQGSATQRDLVDWCLHPDLEGRIAAIPNYGRKSQRELARVLRDRARLTDSLMGL